MEQCWHTLFPTQPGNRSKREMKARFARKVLILRERGNRLKRIDGFPTPAHDPDMHINYAG